MLLEVPATEIHMLIEQQNGSLANAQKYAKFGIMQGTTWLAFRDMASLFEKYVDGDSGIDFGCGTGRSTRFLSSMGKTVIGVDISSAMIAEAQKIDQESGQSHDYKLIVSDHVPVPDESCDFVFSSFVFFDISSLMRMSTILKEIWRVLKPTGTLIIVTGSEEMHNPCRNWISYVTNYMENLNPKSGNLLKIKIKATEAEFRDYYWTDQDYRHVFYLSNFLIVDHLKPAGHPNDNQEWLDELYCSPYHIYVLKKPDF